MEFLACRGVYIRGVLSKMRKAQDPARPIFEAITNSIDAICDRGDFDGETPKITVEFHFHKGVIPGENGYFSHIVVSDNGVGINDKGFRRLTRLFDGSKGQLNKGSGRVQFIKFFTTTEISSVYKKDDNLFSRKCVLSAKDAFLDEDAILAFEEPTLLKEKADIGTTVVFYNPSHKDTQFYENVVIKELREAILSSYLLRFSFLNFDLRIELACFRGDEKIDESFIDSSDFLKPTVENVHVGYKSVEKTSKGVKFVEREDKGKEVFTVSVFCVPKERQDKNEDFFTSRGEKIENAKLSLLPSHDTLNDKRLIVTISGEYIDERVSETRDRLLIPTDSILKRNAEKITENTEDNPVSENYSDAFITLDDIRKAVVETCSRLFPEINRRRRERDVEIERIGKAYGFSSSVARDVSDKIALGDSPEKILRLMYRCEAEKIASMDEKFDAAVRRVEDLDPTNDTYRADLIKRAKRVLRSTPERNRLALSHYVARRKIVLDVFEKALQRSLTIQNGEKRSKDEARLHNIFFAQGTIAPFYSDLWLLEEEYLYYSGTSEKPLKEIEFNGKKLLKDVSQCSAEDQKYLSSGGKDRTSLRPDILIFPSEGKCVLIEFKRPGVDLSQYVDQLQVYASLIREFCSSDCEITRFYTYLIGDKIIPRDLFRVDPDLKESKQFGFMHAIHDVKVEGKEPGTNFFEVHTYDTLLARAKVRNKIFFNLLLGDESQ